MTHTVNSVGFILSEFHQSLTSHLLQRLILEILCTMDKNCTLALTMSVTYVQLPAVNQRL